MPVEDLPEWTTEMDVEILNVLSVFLVLTPAVIADNIDRSREAVARRLNALEAGGLVEKVDRGKYKITGKAVFMLWERVEVTEEGREEAAREDLIRAEEIQEELGMTEAEFQEAVMEEFGRLRGDRLGYWSDGELLEEAARNVGGEGEGGVKVWRYR